MSRPLRFAAIVAGSVIAVVAVVKMTTATAPRHADPASRAGAPAATTSPDVGNPASSPAIAPTVAAPIAPEAQKSASQAQAPLDPIGRVQPVPENTNPQVALVAAAIKAGDHPERLSAMVQPAPFVAGSDPTAYAAEIAPGRAFQSAQPGPGVPVLGAVGPTQMTMDQDGQVYLRARSQPGSPVTFTSFDLGHFQNALATQTVVADANGVASVAFQAGPGTIDAVHVLAGSPQASGQVTFTITVEPAARAAASPTTSAPALPTRSGI